MSAPGVDVRPARRREGLAEAGLLLALAAAPWPHGGAPDVARYSLAAFLLACVGLWLAARWRAGAGLPRLALPVAALAALPLAQAATRTSAAPIWSLESFLLLAAMLGVLLVWRELGRERAVAVRAAVAALAVCAAQAVFGVVQWSLAADRIYGRTRTLATAPFGSYVNHNHFAGLMGMGVVLSAAMALGHARRAGSLTPSSLALGGLSLALAAAHLASRSRAGALALGLGLVVMVLLWSRFGRQKRRGRWLLAAAAAAALIAAFALAVNPSASRRHLATVWRGTGDASGAYRWDVAGSTLQLAASRPLLGAGIGAYADAVAAFKRGHGDVRTTHAESDVFESLAEGGLVGAALLAWLAWSLLEGFRDRLQRGRDPFRVSIAVGGLAAAIAANALFDFNLRLPANALMLVTLLGLAASPREEEPPIGGGWLSAATAVAVLGLSVLCVWRTLGAVAWSEAQQAPAGERRLAALDTVLRGHPYLAEAWRERGLTWRDLGWNRVAGGSARLARARQDLERALRLRPRWGEAWADLGWTLFVLGDPPAAQAALERAAELDPTHVGIGVARAELLARMAGPESAIHELVRVRRLNPWWPLHEALGHAGRWTRERARLAALSNGSASDEAAVDRQLAAP
jgi:tetratricopeptide (TPR) repeat protein